jgi:hypothetical protein
MTEQVNHFISQPRWFIIPLVVIYLAMCGYFVYTLLRYRWKKQ